MSQGLYFAWREPTALMLMIQAAPSFFIAQTLARWFNSVGRIRWPRPCLGKNTTSRPASFPVRKLSEGGPNGVLTLTHFWSVNPSILYRPLPPMIPIRYFDTPHFIAARRMHGEPILNRRASGQSLCAARRNVAKRLECVELSPAVGWSRQFESRSKLHALQTLRATRFWLHGPAGGCASTVTEAVVCQGAK